MRIFVRNTAIMVSSIVILVAIAVSLYFYSKYYAAQQLLKNPNLVAQQQTSQLISQVGRLMELPKNETPTIATVNDITKLKDQPFFANAENGDKVLIYTNAKIAILYSPAAGKIINVAPVNIGNTVVSPTPSVTLEAAPKVTQTPSASVSPMLTPTPAK